MRRMRFTVAAGTLVFGLAGLLVPSRALALRYDISLRGLGRADDPGAQLRLQGLSAELALAMAPRPLQPAETLGVSGFEFSIGNSLTGISSNAPYWQGQPGAPVMEGILSGHQVPNALWTPTAHLRKGLPFSTEMGLQATYLPYSQLVMIGGEVKVALHESFYRWVPTLSLRLAGARLLGSSELDLTTAEGDAMTSLAFGIGGMAKLTPYVGYGILATRVSTSVLDATPYLVTDPTDQTTGSTGSLYQFKTIGFHQAYYSRWFGGLRVNTSVIEILYELDVGILGFEHDKKIMTHTIKLGFDV